MKKCLLIVLAAAFGLYMFGCAKKDQALEETSAPMTMEAMSSMSASQLAEAKTLQPKIETMQTVSAPAALEPLPPSGPYKPTNREIQTALKNAGLYLGEVDGVIGPKTKQAIEEFQNANGLQADGKVGPKTWAALSAHLNPQPVAPATKKR